MSTLLRIGLMLGLLPTTGLIHAAQITFSCPLASGIRTNGTLGCPQFDSDPGNQITAVELQYVLNGFSPNGPAGQIQLLATFTAPADFSHSPFTYNLIGHGVATTTFGFGPDAPQLFPIPADTFGAFSVTVLDISGGSSGGIWTALESSVRYTYGPASTAPTPEPGSWILTLIPLAWVMRHRPSNP
jgi:hypothetical protein